MKHECGKPPRYLCVYCNYKSVYKHDVQKHARRKHPNGDNAVIELYNTTGKHRKFDSGFLMMHETFGQLDSSDSSSSKKYPCPNPNCTSVFKEKRHLGTHINYHCGKPPRFQCPYCEYMSHMKCNVKTHCKKRHSDQEIWVVERYSSRVPGNFPCLNGNCGSAFKDELHLRKHLKTCGAPPRFKCTYCDHSSKWSSDMRKHVQVVHPGSEKAGTTV
ncbi:Similar to Znf711: Zinc finger protein 711 (Mus musculus) [Cotesia congregata]|uniref:Similar to Znf711: Zinc finger protein 711 (Mus musculus) n=1 Tax=Cotesia congregata TaxID=51543 RepID=A0A8J2HFM9_COTCN|nr:Similar to Znf711: Zinc finger protein 711 (Mus musculus) [Cotesia congregata]